MLLEELLRPTAPATIRMYRDELREMLAEVFASVSVQSQWAAPVEGDLMYSPRVDIAVGPFSDSASKSNFNDFIRSRSGLIYALFHTHRSNLRNHGEPDDNFSLQEFCSGNPNARCFLAFEMETGTSSKQLIGASVNVAALGRIGIVVAWTGIQLKALISVRKYLLYLGKERGYAPSPSNLLLLTAQQVEACVRQERRHARSPTGRGAWV